MTAAPWHTCGGRSQSRIRRYNITGAAVALLTVSFGLRAAQFTTAAIPGVCLAGTPIEIIRDGFEGTEGPVALPDAGLLFVENRASRVTRIGMDGSVSPS